MISLVLVSGLVSSSLFSLVHTAVADDMMGDPMGGDGGDGNGNDDDSDGISTPENASPTADTGGGSSNNNDGQNSVSGKSNDDNTGDKSNNDDKPTVTPKTNCPQGQEYYLFSSSCQPTLADNPTIVAPATVPSTTCPTSYYPNEKESITSHAKSEQSTMIEHPLINNAAKDSSMFDIGLKLGGIPRLHHVANQPLPTGQKDPLAGLGDCKITNYQLDPKTNTNTRTIEFTDGSKTIQVIDSGGTISRQEKYDKSGFVIQSSVLSPNDVQTIANIKPGKGNNKMCPDNIFCDRADIHITERGEFKTAFSIHSTGILEIPEAVIPTANHNPPKYTIDKDNHVTGVEFSEKKTGVTIQVTYAKGIHAGWLAIDANNNDGTPLAKGLVMSPQGVLLR
jgi:hypothetical protein